ncbi:MAG: SRPBCC family protein [Desulfuromonadaceae bacterium]|nr:SRPBCC family protein [Desulfuromonadaceae bacterium]MDD5107239.1 SRPBCC family protein [Desulfuromonadaceae bacterium]
MRPFTIERTQILPITLKTAWDFFSNPANLVKITPPEMDFRITSPPQNTIHAGQIITYRVRPLMRIAVNWTTEITHVDPPYFFVDEQRFGPYRFWHHQHHFREVDSGVEMHDLVHYLLMYEQLSWLTNRLFVAPRLKAIFDYRNRMLIKLFSDLSC